MIHHHHNYKKKSLQQIFETFSHYQQVSFAFYCAKEVEHLFDDQRVIDCNQVLQRWLKGDKTVDLITARNNAWNTYSAYYAAVANAATAFATASAVYATTAAYYVVSAASAHASVSAATAAYYVVSASSATARAKSYNLYPDDETKRNIAYNQFHNEYNQIAQNWLSLWEIPNFPKEEPDFPIFDFLQDYNLISYLLPKKEDYYYLNLNGFNIKHQNEAELLKEIDTIHIKTILRRIINNDSTS